MLTPDPAGSNARIPQILHPNRPVVQSFALNGGQNLANTHVPAASPSPAGTDGPLPIYLSTTLHFDNKVNNAPYTRFCKRHQTRDTCWAHGAFENVEWTPEQITRHLLAGKAICVSAHTQNWRRQDYFKSSQLMGVDFDKGPGVDTVAAMPLGEYAFLIYSTASHKPEAPRTRALFRLDREITDKTQIRRLLKRLLYHFSKRAEGIDISCKDAARVFYGSKDAEHLLRANAVLSVDALEALPIHPDELPRPVISRRPIDTSNTADMNRAERSAARFKERWLAKLASAGEGNRHPELKRIAPMLIARAAWPGFERIDDDIRQVGQGIGLPLDEIDGMIQWARDNVTPEAQELPASQPHQAEYPAPAAPIMPALQADIAICQRWTSEVDPALLPASGALIIKAPMDTGKTELINREKKRLEKILGRSIRVLYISHRRALIKTTSERLFFECYEVIDKNDWRLVPYLGICLNSTPGLCGVGETLPQYDLIVIDEIEQVLAHLGGRTFKRGQAAQAYETLCELVKSARLVMAMDAHAGPISYDWLNDVRGNVRVLTNTYKLDRGPLTRYEKRSALIAAANRIIDEESGGVVIATNSRAEAKKLRRYYANRLGESTVYMICSDNSESDEAQAFIRDIFHRLPQLRVFIYSPSLGSGIDIQCPVRAVFGVFHAKPLPASELHQLLGRCRHTQETHVYVHPGVGGLETDAEAIFNRRKQAALKTGAACQFDENNIRVLTPIQESLSRLLSKIDAKRNASMNALAAHFVVLADGYTLHYQDGDDKAVKQALDEAGQAQKDAEKAAVLAAAPVTHELYEHLQRTGGMTPEVRAGHDRFTIEDCVGLTINPKIYDDLHTESKRAALRAYCDLLEDIDILREYDRQQARDGVPLHSLKHRYICARIIKTLLNRVMTKDGKPAELTAEDITEAVARFFEQYGDDLYTFFNWRACHHSENPVAVLRRMLAAAGLKLASTQVMKDRKRYRVYTLDADQVAIMRAYARARRAHLERKNAERMAEGDYLKSDSISKKPVLSNVQSGLEMPVKKDVIAARRAAGKPINPMSKGVTHAATYTL